MHHIFMFNKWKHKVQRRIRDLSIYLNRVVFEALSTNPSCLNFVPSHCYLFASIRTRHWIIGKVASLKFKMILFRSNCHTIVLTTIFIEEYSLWKLGFKWLTLCFSLSHVGPSMANWPIARFFIHPIFM